MPINSPRPTALQVAKQAPPAASQKAVQLALLRANRLATLGEALAASRPAAAALRTRVRRASAGA